MKKLTIAILNYNSGDYFRKCLDSIESVRGEADISVIAIDNNSTDGSYKSVINKFKNVRFVQNGENLGFSKGYNPSLKKIKSEFILLLNPDCLLEKGVIKKTLEDFDTYEKVGAVTAKIILPNGKTDLTAHRGFPTPFASLMYAFNNDRWYHLTNKLSDDVHEVDAVAGAFLLTKKTILEEVGFLDPRFFLYGEDIDLCLRIKKRGYKILYDPTVSVTHYKGISSGLKKHTQEISAADKKTKKRALNAFYEAMFLFYDKHYKKKYPFFISWLVYLGIYLRWNLAKIKKSV